MVDELLKESDAELAVPHDTVYDELKATADSFGMKSEDMAMILSIYMLGFSTYSGFEAITQSDNKES